MEEYFKWPRVYKNEPGLISKDVCWSIIHQGYLYIDDTLFKTIWQFLTEYKNDRHLVG